jgi:hypothetical protein
VATTWSPPVIGLVFGGAVLLAIGSLLPWLTASLSHGVDVTRHGYDGDGVYTVAAAAIIALALGLFPPRQITARALLAVGIVVAGITIYNVLHASQAAETLLARSRGVNTTIGSGLLLSVLAALLIVVGCVLAIRDTSPASSTTQI